MTLLSFGSSTKCDSIRYSPSRATFVGARGFRAAARRPAADCAADLERSVGVGALRLGERLRAVSDQKLGIRRQDVRGSRVDRFPSLGLHFVEESLIDIAGSAT